MVVEKEPCDEALVLAPALHGFLTVVFIGAALLLREAAMVSETRP